MSVEEDIELRDLVAQTLESNGSLAKIRAQLRASIFLALEEDAQLSKRQPMINNKLTSYQKSAQGKAAFCIVQEFLDYFNLDFTISVYEPESYSGSGYKYEGKQKLIADLGIEGLEHNVSGPILLQLLNIAQNLKQVSVEADNKKPNISASNGSAKMIDNDIHEQKDKSNSKTDLDELSNIVNTKNDINKSKSKWERPQFHEFKQNKIDLEIDIPRVDLNHTYDISSSSIDPSEESESDVGNEKTTNNSHLEPYAQSVSSSYTKESKEDSHKKDVFDNTKSISDDNRSPNQVEKLQESQDEKTFKSSFSSVSSDIASNIKENKSKQDIDKHSPQKSEKHKAKSNLSSLSDLPPLPGGKHIMSNILSSVCNKESKDKPNLKDLDEMFDIQIDYEEDFISGSELDLSMNKSLAAVSAQQSGKIDVISGNGSTQNEETETINGEHDRKLNEDNIDIERANNTNVSTSCHSSSSISEDLTVNTESSNKPK